MRRSLCLLAVLAALPLSGCGGGDDKASADQYRKQAATICKQARSESNAVKQPTKATSDALVSYLQDLLKVNQRTTDRFSHLKPPDELKDKHQRVLSTNREAVKVVESLVNQLKAGTPAKAVFANSQARLQSITTRATDAVKALGVPECGRS